MNVVILHGSPRVNGDSDTLVSAFLEELSELTTIETRHFRLNDMSISPCQGCLDCMRDEQHRCATTDDMELIYDAFRWGELIVWATPMYWGYMTAQMKTALDRMEALVWGDGWTGKTFAVFLTYHYHVASTVGFFERVCPFFHVDAHIVTCRTMDDQERHIPASQCHAALQECRMLAERIANL